ncbi:MAG TPA: C25 family cysteine peptidase, partial [Gemmataceae bacterium]|nr:C25 family cysteine peptidase [Gemmataceae bacterium]
MRRWCLVLLLLLPSAAAAAGAPPQWVIVTAPAFRAAVEPLCALRRNQGMRVAVVQTTDVLSDNEILAGEAGKLRAKVNQLCRESTGPSYVLLVCRVSVEAGNLDESLRATVPPLRGTVSRMKGQVSDNGYGCPGEGVVPTVAVGRLPARTVEECRQMVAKTLAWERDTRPGPWRRQLAVLAGVPAFNPFVDKLVESLALARLDQVDPSWTGQAIYHNAQSRFCVPDALLHEQALGLVQAGAAFTVYLGHSSAEGFYAAGARYLDRDDWARLHMARGPGIFITFGCNGCQLCGRNGEGYGVAAVRNPGGPVAAVGSHGICFAAMVELAGDGLFKSLFAARPPQRLGDAYLRLKENLAHGKIDPLSFRLLDAVDGDSRIPLADQRLE